MERAWFAHSWNGGACCAGARSLQLKDVVLCMLRIISRALVALVFLLACCTNSGGDTGLHRDHAVGAGAGGSPGDAQGSSGTSGARPPTEPEEQPSEISPTCEPPPDCLPIVSLLNLGVCCSETLRCGIDVSPVAAVAPMHPELAATFGVDPEKPCWPRARLFLEVPTPETLRIEVDDGEDVLIAPSCGGRLVTTTQMLGCCRRDNTCGYDTHLVRGTFHALSSGASAEAFSSAECLNATELNARLRDSELEAFAHVPPSTGDCDYAALDAALQ